MPQPPFQATTFDRNSAWSVIERKLPHWIQPGAITYITFRTCDSIPENVLKSWHAERDEWLIKHGIGNISDWREKLSALSLQLQEEYRERFANRWDNYLDSCFGECVLKRPELAAILHDSLLHFDGDRYLLTDFVVMPNHVHLMAAFPDENAMLNQCESWKKFTATEINRRLNRKGRFWQQDGFDHLVRSEGQFLKYREYIAHNPVKAKLNNSEYIHFSKS